MRKIKISGCANCPYLSVYFDNSENEEPHISSGACNHPQFDKSLPRMRIGPTNFIEFESKMLGEDYSGMGPTGNGEPDKTPKWCPLPIDYETVK